TQNLDIDPAIFAPARYHELIAEPLRRHPDDNGLALEAARIDLAVQDVGGAARRTRAWRERIINPEFAARLPFVARHERGEHRDVAAAFERVCILEAPNFIRIIIFDGDGAQTGLSFQSGEGAHIVESPILRADSLEIG